jgi:hypothetical protein
MRAATDGVREDTRGLDVLWLILLLLFVVTLVRVSMRWGRDAAMREMREPAPAKVVGAFPVLMPPAGDGTEAGQYRVTGVSRETGEDVELRLEAASAAHAAYKADLHRVRVHAAVRMDEVGAADPADEAITTTAATESVAAADGQTS